MTITENIFRILNEKNNLQKEFSEMTGVAPSTICDWKKGKSPNSDKIDRMMAYIVALNGRIDKRAK